MKKIGTFATFTMLLLFCTISFGQEQATSPDYSWLNGKWQGPPPMGGNFVIDLQVVNGNQVKGSGRNQLGGGRNATTAKITGTVNGDRVELDAFFSGRTTVKYLLTFTDGVLVGQGIHPDLSAPVATTFRKLN